MPTGFFPSIVLLLGGIVPAFAQVVDSFTESTIPSTHQVKPGITRITGGITTAGGEDVFTFLGTAEGTVTARITYTHQTGNLLLGRPERAHLLGDLEKGLSLRPDLFLPSSGVSLSSPFIVSGGTNTISATADIGIGPGTDVVNRLVIKAPAGLVNSSYTAELEYQPMRDPWDSGGLSNDSAPEAFPVHTTAGFFSGTLHSALDEDWFRFSVPAGRTLRINVEAGAGGVVDNRTIRSELRNAQAVPLQNAETVNASFSETAGAADRVYLLRLSAADGYAQGWRIQHIVDDDLEPNDTPAQSVNLGTLAVGSRIERDGLAVINGNDDYFSFQSGLPAGTPIIIAALRETDFPFGPRVLISGGSSTAESLSDYTIVTAPVLGTITFRVYDQARNYRLLIKARSAYDAWQRIEGGENYALPPYLPINSDWDRDGLPAGLEWALRRSPFFVEALPAYSSPYQEGGLWQVNVAMPQGGAAAPILVRESVDLRTWSAMPAARTNTGGSTIPAGRTAGAVFTLSRPGAAKNFLRFEVND